MTITDLQAEDRPQRVSKLKAQSHTRKSPRLNPGVEDQSTQLNSPIANEVLQVTVRYVMPTSSPDLTLL